MALTLQPRTTAVENDLVELLQIKSNWKLRFKELSNRHVPRVELEQIFECRQSEAKSPSSSLLEQIFK